MPLTTNSMITSPKTSSPSLSPYLTEGVCVFGLFLSMESDCLYLSKNKDLNQFACHFCRSFIYINCNYNCNYI